MISDVLLALAAAAGATPPAAAGATPPVATDAGECSGSSPSTIVVCGQTGERSRYRIDSSVLAATRAHDAPPIKPPLDATRFSDAGCVGPMTCTGGTIPLIGAALVAAKAAELALAGDDWRKALRIHADEYAAYRDAEARRAKARGVHIGLGMGATK